MPARSRHLSRAARLAYCCFPEAHCRSSESSRIEHLSITKDYDNKSITIVEIDQRGATSGEGHSEAAIA